MDESTLVVTVVSAVSGAVSAWAGAHGGVAELSQKVSVLTHRVGQLEVVVGLRGALRAKDAQSPYTPEALAALVAAEGGERRPPRVDNDPTPPDGTKAP